MSDTCGVPGCTPAVHAWHQPAGQHSLRLGPLRVTYVVDGVMRLSPHRFLPAVPAGHWRTHSYLLDSGGWLVMSTGGLLIQHESGRSMLIDTGFGPFRGDIGFGSVTCGALPLALARTGLRPDAIDTVAFTHLHIDHVGWAFDEDRRPTFPRALYWVAANELPHYQDGHIETGAPSAARVITPLARLAHRFGDGEEIFPGVTTWLTPGHSPGHTTYLVRHGEHRLVVFGDVLHSPTQLVHPAWGAAPDHDPAQAATTRDVVRARLHLPGTIGFGMHFADRPFGHLTDDAGPGVPWAPVT
ncbi:MBL fold metallo-hydrolase [Streptomyces sp. NPDC127068]|uniref:MBL fold metallo-hydrolase n=1 Tax=Streptomyces sp. NPDC127068 TaxID=3347127 RepID=UPI0036664E0D